MTSDINQVHLKKLEKLPEGWAETTVGEVVKMISTNGKKLQQKKYLEKAEHPVIDQGREYIGGYHSNSELLIDGTPPFVIFGDHSRIFKFANFRFIPGADGVKIMQPIGINPKWAYYIFQSLRLPNKGYSRHFQYLKEAYLPVPPPEQQKRIVAKIEELFSHIDAGIAALNKAKQLLKQYRQSVLKAAVTGELTKAWREENKDKLEPASVLLERILKERRQKWEEKQLEAFKAKGKVPKDDGWKGKYKEPKNAALLVDIDNPAEWEMTSVDQVAEVFLGKMLDKSKHTKGHKLPYLRNINVRWGSVETDDVSEMFFKDDELARYNLEAGDVLVCEGGEPGRTSVWCGEIENMKYQKALHRVRFYLPLNPKYIALLLEYFASTGLLSRYFTGSTIKHFTKESFTSLPFPLPSLSEMEEIVSLVDEKIISLKRLESELEVSLLRAGKNKQSILASAFSGKLSDET